jgi:hypothetical protein
MAAHETDERGEPIDVDFEPARRDHDGIGVGAAAALAVLAAFGGGAIGAIAPRTQALSHLLDSVAPDALTQTRLMQAQSSLTLAEAKQKLHAIDVAGGVSPTFRADYLQTKADLAVAQEKLAKLEVAMKLFPDGPEEGSVLRTRLAALEAVPKNPKDIEKIEFARVAASLQARLDVLENRAGKQAEFTIVAGATPAEIMAQLKAVQATQKTLDAKLTTAASAADLASVSGDLKTLQAQFNDVAKGAKAATDAARVAYAVSAATDASRSAGPFEAAFNALAAVAPQDANVLALAPLAKKGAPTRDELRDDFAKIELEMIRAARAGQTGGGLMGQVQASLAQFVVVRRVGERDDTGDLAEDASRRIAANDLEGAVARLQKLDGQAGKIVAPWLEKAKLRVEIDQRLAAIRTQLSRRG